MLRSKGRNNLFDEKGVFGRVCRHEYPKGFISIKHGERLDVIMCSVYLYCICTSVYYMVGSEIVRKYTVRYFPYRIPPITFVHVCSCHNDYLQ